MNFFKNLSKRDRIILTVLLVVGVLYVGDTFFLRPYLFEKSSLEERRMYLEERLKYYSSLERGLVELKGDYDLAQQRLDELQERLFSKRQAPIFPHMVRELVRRHGLEVVNLNSKDIISIGDLSAMPLDLTVMGTYENMVLLIDSLQSFESLLQINTLSLHYEGLYYGEGYPMIIVRMSLNCNLYLTDREGGDSLGRTNI